MKTVGSELSKASLKSLLAHEGREQEYEVYLLGGMKISGTISIDGMIATMDGWTFNLKHVVAWRPLSESTL